MGRQGLNFGSLAIIIFLYNFRFIIQNIPKSNYLFVKPEFLPKTELGYA